ncbi:cytosine permease [Kroppenstedtia pulmonis]|uniref:Cytosine permease n=1 Tax=Kroppenstedtia pulmonis TaxID=1380685 RepID=A0A7D4BKT6_9BACL|nr:cytosine permease [Kroppenstedtia pulmonis]QKG85050.1 cytosine permease [Kroppenstedtia pulmonis]
MAKVSKILLDRDYARMPVPLARRRGWIRLSLIWVAMGVDLSALVLGSALASGMTLLKAMIAVSAGSLILASIGAACSYVGSTTSLSTAMINRFTFGERGAMVVILISTITFLGWFGVTAGFFGESAHVVIKTVIGWDVNPRWFILIGGILMTGTAAIGYKAIEKLSFVAVPLMLSFLAGLILKLYMEGNQLSLLLTMLPEGDPMGLGTAISLVVGAFILGCAGSPDVARWAKNSKDAVLSGFFGFLIGNSIMMFVAAFLSRLTGTEDVIQIMLSIGWGVIAVILLILAQWTTNDNHMYSVGLNLSVLFKWIPKRVLTVIAGMVGTLFALLGIYEKFIGFLTVLSPFAAPIAGIYLVEYFFLNRGQFQIVYLREMKVSAIRWHSLTVWLLSALLAMMTTPSEDGGLGLFTLTQIPVLDGLFTSMFLQYVIGKALVRFKGKATNSENQGA